MPASAHLVGSLPGDSEAEAMGIALDLLGPHLRSLPDGETGDRRNWIIHIVESLRHHPDLRLERDGAWTDYDDLPRFRVRPGHELTGASLDLGHIAAFDRAYPVFTELRERHGHPGLRFQVGIPGDFDMALFTFGPTGPWRQRAAFTEATVNEIRAIHARAGDDVVFQIEVPAELVMVARMPVPLQPALATYLARGIVGLAAQGPIGARFGVHLCLGDMNHRAFGRMRDAGPLVRLTNAIVDRWPASRPLDFVHLPLAAAVEPPPNRRSFYAPLRDLRLPPDVAFIAGFVHEALGVDAQVALQRHLAALTGRQVDLATSCGLGRRDRADADAAMALTATLCERGP